MSEKRDIFPHHPQGYESGFPEKEAMMTQKAEEEEKHVMTGRKMAAKFSYGKKKEARKERWKCDTAVKKKNRLL